MQLLFVRHADPDYEHDTITETGWKEAKALSERLCKLSIDEFYVSPLGRAKDTLSLTLEKMGREAIVHDWLREFDVNIHRPDQEGLSIAWDWLPKDWTVEDGFYRMDEWHESEVMKEGKVYQEYCRVTGGLDALLEEHGYRRKGRYYEVVSSNHQRIVCMCHFGVQCVLLSHLLGVSPMIFWHGLAAAPASVTTVYTEERRRGAASFRVNAFGDVSHLYAAGLEPSFSARFCECFEDDTRHD